MTHLSRKKTCSIETVIYQKFVDQSQDEIHVLSLYPILYCHYYILLYKKKKKVTFIKSKFFFFKHFMKNKEKGKGSSLIYAPLDKRLRTMNHNAKHNLISTTHLIISPRCWRRLIHPFNLIIKQKKEIIKQETITVNTYKKQTMRWKFKNLRSISATISRHDVTTNNIRQSWSTTQKNNQPHQKKVPAFGEKKNVWISNQTRPINNVPQKSSRKRWLRGRYAI